MRHTIAAVMAGLVMVTAGCASAAVQAPSTKGIGPITFAIGSDDIGWLGLVIAKWNAMYPAQAVTPLYLPQAANVQLAQLVANLQAKSQVYDVVDMDVVWTAEFASNGWIIPLPENQFPLAEFFPQAVSTAKYQGRLYAVPDYSNADLLYYRKDILAKAGVDRPPTTWAQLEYLAKTVAPRYGLQGYAGTFAQYEGLTVNFAEGVQSAGGSILNAAGTQVTLDTPQALAGLEFLVDGFRQGWIPKATLKYEEVSAQDEFVSGKFLFLNDWPDVYAALGPGASQKYGIAALPGLNGPGSSSLGGANLAISAYSQHQQTALHFIQFMTTPQIQTIMLERGSFPPVLKQLYAESALTSRFKYLPTLYDAIETAQPRPAISNYDQASLVISSETYEALQGAMTPQEALAHMQRQLTEIIRNGLAPQ
jgi:multiple sugar transport system substrate-binding protein